MILVVGATGALGGLIARRLLATGRKVRILVRPGSTYQPLVAAGAEAIIGDLKEPLDMREASARYGVPPTSLQNVGS
jgi:uncharacterized protein YbjT (DUF2867 family)